MMRYSFGSLLSSPLTASAAARPRPTMTIFLNSSAAIGRDARVVEGDRARRSRRFHAHLAIGGHSAELRTTAAGQREPRALVPAPRPPSLPSIDHVSFLCEGEQVPAIESGSRRFLAWPPSSELESTAGPDRGRGCLAAFSSYAMLPLVYRSLGDVRGCLASKRDSRPPWSRRPMIARVLAICPVSWSSRICKPCLSVVRLKPRSQYVSARAVEGRSSEASEQHSARRRQRRLKRMRQPSLTRLQL